MHREMFAGAHPLGITQNMKCKHTQHSVTGIGALHVLPAAAKPTQYGEYGGGYYQPNYNSYYPKEKEKHKEKHVIKHEPKPEVCSCVGYPGQDGPPGASCREEQL